MILSNLKENKLRKNQGLTLLELLITMSIFVIIMIAIGSFVGDIFSYNKMFNNSLTTYDQIRRVLQPIASEVRSASPSSLGSYPILSAQDNSFSFFSDINDDGLKEKIRYFLSGTSLLRGVIYPTGNPLSYSSSEIVSTIVVNVNNNLVPVFNYYDQDYSGEELPLVQPVNIAEIRLVKITLIVDDNPNKPPRPVTISTEVSLRNLKDNL